MDKALTVRDNALAVRSEVGEAANAAAAFADYRSRKAPNTIRRQDAALALFSKYLAQAAAIAYWSALHYWHLTERLPHTVFVQSTSRKHQREKEVLGVPYRFVTVVESKFFGVVDHTQDGQTIRVTDREKTLVDAADRPDLSGGIAQLAQALRAA